MIISPTSDSSESPPIRRRLAAHNKLLITRSPVDKPHCPRQLVKLSPAFSVGPLIAFTRCRFQISMKIIARPHVQSTAEGLQSIQLVSYLTAKLADGTNHVATSQVNGASEQLGVTIQNSAYQPCISHRGQGL